MPAPEPFLPRHQQGARSQELLTVLLGDYWHLRTDPIPSGALVDLLEVFGVTTPGARAAIQRLAQRGFFVALRDGRTTSYAVRAMSRDAIDRHVSVLFQSKFSHEWDGTWTLVAYSLPEGARATRHLLREQLRRRHFGNLFDALWVRPGNCLAEIREIREELGSSLPGDRLTAFVGARLPEIDSVAEALSSAFDLDDLRSEYRAFIQRWTAVAANAAEAISNDADLERQDDALRTRTSIMREWRELRHSDPMLPAELLGADFPFEEALRICSAVYDPLGPLAEAAFRRRLQPYDALLADLVTHHTFSGPAVLLT